MEVWTCILPVRKRTELPRKGWHQGLFVLVGQLLRCVLRCVLRRVLRWGGLHVRGVPAGCRRQPGCGRRGLTALKRFRHHCRKLTGAVGKQPFPQLAQRVTLIPHGRGQILKRKEHHAPLSMEALKCDLCEL